MSYTDTDFEAPAAASHTPGPWAIYSLTVSGETTVWVRCDSRVIADLVTDGPSVEADARLIAAAPDLLAALKALHHQCDYMGAPADHPDMLAAAAAIAKATGREP